jgi:predicted transcriptional regulator
LNEAKSLVVKMGLSDGSAERTVFAQRLLLLSSIIGENDNAGITRLVETTGLHHGAVKKQVAALQDAGLVRRTKNGFGLTPAGLDALAAAFDFRGNASNLEIRERRVKLSD